MLLLTFERSRPTRAMFRVPSAAFIDALLVTELKQVLHEMLRGPRCVWSKELPMEVEVRHEGRIYTTEAQGHREHRE